MARTFARVAPGPTAGCLALPPVKALVVAGLPVAAEVFRQLDAAVAFTPLAGEGEIVAAGAATLGGGLEGERDEVVRLDVTRHRRGVEN